MLLYIQYKHFTFLKSKKLIALTIEQFFFSFSFIYIIASVMSHHDHLRLLVLDRIIEHPLHLELVPSLEDHLVDLRQHHVVFLQSERDPGRHPPVDREHDHPLASHAANLDELAVPVVVNDQGLVAPNLHVFGTAEIRICQHDVETIHSPHLEVIPERFVEFDVARTETLVVVEGDEDIVIGAHTNAISRFHVNCQRRAAPHLGHNITHSGFGTVLLNFERKNCLGEKN